MESAGFMRFMHRSRQPSSVLSGLCNDFSDGRLGTRRKRCRISPEAIAVIARLVWLSSGLGGFFGCPFSS